ncbi:MAG: NADP-dependent malic enzyme [Candidatus Bathyarchaeia archaeon]
MEAGSDWNRLALEYSRHYAGKIDVTPKVPITNLHDFSYWYTPGVAAVSMAIHADRELSYELTGRWNTIAIVGDGSRVLGLGNIGGEAALPVLEGKSLIFKFLGGVNAVPLPLGTQEADKIETVAKSIEPAFGGINLEDIESPKCFGILERLRGSMNIPVWHDDQQGNAGAVLAAVYNSLELTSRRLGDTRIVFLGAGAANIATLRLLIAAGADAGKIVMVDSKGIIHPERDDMDQLMLKHPWKYELALKTNRDRIKGSLSDALVGADVLIAASTPGPGTVKKEDVSKMNRDAIVFAEANPVPEIWPRELKEVGVRIVATGRSDFPNQVNNSLVFPSVFRGALDARSKTVTDTMVIEAATELAKYARERGLREDYIIPRMQEWEVYPRVAAAVAHKSVTEGLAKRKMSRNDFYELAREIISRSREQMRKALENGVIEPLPELKSVST